MLPLVLGEECHFFGGPAAFGTYGEGSVCFLRVGDCCGESSGEGERLLGFGEEDAGGGFLLFKGEFEGCWVCDLGDVGAAGLL